MGAAEEEPFDRAAVRCDCIRITRIESGDSLALFSLVKDHAGGAHQCVDEVSGIDVGEQDSVLLRANDERGDLAEEGLHVAIAQPSHSWASVLSLIMHDSNERGVLRYESHVSADEFPE